MSVAFITHPECLLHEMGEGHPERPERLGAIEDKLLAMRLDYLVARVEVYEESVENSLEQEGLKHAVSDQFRRLVELSPSLGKLSHNKASRKFTQDGKKPPL